MNLSIRSTILLVLLIGFYQPVQADGLLRLFTTAQDRAALDAERSKPDKPEPPRKKPRYITVNGLVARSRGPSTVWVNGSNNLFQQDFRVELDKQAETTVLIFLSNSKQTIRLKPGQTVNTLNGTIKENFQQPSRAHESP